MSTQPTPAAPAAKRSPNAARAFGIIAVAAGLFFGGRYYIWSQTHVATDDAYVTGNIVMVSPTVGGTLSQLMVAEGDPVTAGQVVAILDDTAQRAALQSAESALLVAKGNVRQAEAQLTLQKASDVAAMAKAQATTKVSLTKIKAAEAGVLASVDETSTRIATLKASVAASEATAAQAIAALNGGKNQADAAKAAATTVAAGVRSATANLAAVKARVPSAEAELQRAERDHGRFVQLFAKQAVTRQQAGKDKTNKQTESATSATMTIRNKKWARCPRLRVPNHVGAGALTTELSHTHRKHTKTQELESSVGAPALHTKSCALAAS